MDIDQKNSQLEPSIDSKNKQLVRREKRIKNIEHVFSYVRNLALFLVLFSRASFYIFILLCIWESICYVWSNAPITWFEKIVDVINKLNTTSIILIISIIIAIISLSVNKAIIPFKNKVNIRNRD